MSELATSNAFTDEDLLSIGSFNDAIALFQQRNETVTNIGEVLGDGFTLTDNKRSLIGVPFLIMSAKISEGDIVRADGTKGTFTTLRLVTKNGDRLIINDGSSGIHAQIVSLIERDMPAAGLFVARGLRVSEYTYEAPDGSKQPALTFYLDTSSAQ